ncbi:MAG: FAD-dependent monooxygenase [Bacteroidetes bacterium]|nr:FAD-dependent monooxygenase [Bacteroidota bacterium]
MRILIAGAGIAGMTLAALLERRGLDVKVIERASNFEHAGYMLGLWPLGYRVLHGLGLYEDFADLSIPANYYAVRDNHGELIHQWSMDPISSRFGPNLSCTRPQLVKLLHSALCETHVHFDTTLTNARQYEHHVEATMSDGTSEAFDLLVGADGAHSRVRELFFGEQPKFDTGWGGWVWWADRRSVPAKTYVEHWGIGRFLGAYPTTDGVGVFAGAPVGDRFEKDGSGRQERVRARMANMGELAHRLMQSMPDDETKLFFWRLNDVRSNEWTRGRVVLLGDAAASLLPTAGIGASMAMESAAVLADELGRTDVHYLEHALSLFVKRRRKRVEDVQSDSRRLARAMFIESPTLGRLRDLATRFYSLEGLAGSIAKAFDQPI